MHFNNITKNNCYFKPCNSDQIEFMYIAFFNFTFAFSTTLAFQKISGLWMKSDGLFLTDLQQPRNETSHTIGWHSFHPRFKPQWKTVLSALYSLRIRFFLHKQQLVFVYCDLIFVAFVFQGMSYLHAKGIVLPALTAMNVFLESKVKLCVSGYCNRTTRVERWKRVFNLKGSTFIIESYKAESG